jgi:hypothetical protein
VKRIVQIDDFGMVICEPLVIGDDLIGDWRRNAGVIIGMLIAI